MGKGKRKWTKEDRWRWKKEGKRREARAYSLRVNSFLSSMKSHVENMVVVD